MRLRRSVRSVFVGGRRSVVASSRARTRFRPGIRLVDVQYVGVAVFDHAGVAIDRDVDEITVRNQFPDGTPIEGTIEGDGNATGNSGENATVDGTERASFALEPGERASVRVACNQSITIEASGPDIETSVERSIECD